MLGRKVKGTLFGLNRLSEHLKIFYSWHHRNGYFLKCDISKFFYNIPHRQLKDIVHYHFGDKNIQWLCDLYIDSTESPGLPLGNQISQAFALLYLDGMDKLISGEFGVDLYGRYMDDFYLIHHDKEYLQHCLDVITEFLNTLDLKLNSKTQIIPIKNGISYLGFHTYLTADGKVIRKVKNQNKRNAQRKYLKMVKLVEAGKLSKEKFNTSYTAYKNHISHGNCYGLSKSMDKRILSI